MQRQRATGEADQVGGRGSPETSPPTARQAASHTAVQTGIDSSWAFSDGAKRSIYPRSRPGSSISTVPAEWVASAGTIQSSQFRPASFERRVDRQHLLRAQRRSAFQHEDLFPVGDVFHQLPPEEMQPGGLLPPDRFEAHLMFVLKRMIGHAVDRLSRPRTHDLCRRR